MPRIHKCEALSLEAQDPTKTKDSSHFIMDIKCSKPLNSFIAKEINTYYRLITQMKETDKDPVDTGIYSGKRSSLRLPFCVKIKRDVLDARPLVIRSES